MSERKYYLDWLRIIAFALLILFHVGMFYVTWSYNIKSDRVFPNFELAMNSLSPWRLTLLFFISGVASSFLIAKLGAGGFSKDRAVRLIPVILLGMLVINPLQVYVEFLYKDFIGTGYLDFWFNAYLQSAPFPNRMLPTWDHLWFLVYLLFYAQGLSILCKIVPQMQRNTFALPILFVVPGLWLSFSNMLIAQVWPVTMALVDDWGSHLRWLGIFTAGFVCAQRADFWKLAKAERGRLLNFAFAMFCLQLAYGILSRSVEITPTLNGIFYGALSGVYGWSVVLALCGYAAKYLNRQSKSLSYLTDAVLPIYVLHQPILLATAFYIFPFTLPLAAEIGILIAATAAGTLLCYELLIRRWRGVRFLFGLKKLQSRS